MKDRVLAIPLGHRLIGASGRETSGGEGSYRDYSGKEKGRETGRATSRKRCGISARIYMRTQFQHNMQYEHPSVRILLSSRTALILSGRARDTLVVSIRESRDAGMRISDSVSETGSCFIPGDSCEIAFAFYVRLSI